MDERAHDAVDAAMAAVPRVDFLPPDQRSRADYDGPLPIGQGQTNSQPRTVAAMLRLLAVRPGHRVLDVGAGSCWTTALLAHLTGPTGSVLGLELEPELVRSGRARMALRHEGWARVEQARSGVLGDPGGAPYDRILVSAQARSLPGELCVQLVADAADPGRMVVPVDGIMMLVVRTGSTPADLRVSRHGHYRFVPLR